MAKKAFSSANKAYPDVSKYIFDTSKYVVLRMNSPQRTDAAKQISSAQISSKKESKK